MQKKQKTHGRCDLHILEENHLKGNTNPYIFIWRVQRNISIYILNAQSRRYTRHLFSEGVNQIELLTLGKLSKNKAGGILKDFYCSFFLENKI